MRIWASERPRDGGRLTRGRTLAAAAGQVLARLERRLGRRGTALALGAALALTVLLHAKAADPAAQRLADALAHLAAAAAIDARWEAAAALGPGAPVHVVPAADATRIQRALEAAAEAAPDGEVHARVMDLRKGFGEKTGLIARLQQASADARAALAAALRADAAVTALVRHAWQTFPQRERLIAAEHLAIRVLAEAQQYAHAPTAANRANLEGYAADLPNAHTLPESVREGLARLESDVHQLLLLKPLEQALRERIRALETGPRLTALIETYQDALAHAGASARRYRLALIVWSAAFALLLAYVALRAIARFRDLEELSERARRENGAAPGTEQAERKRA